jgi:radical SAM superfamily enzyme YgiQ (UPF0313 family)
MYETIIFTDVVDTVTVYKAIGAYKIANTLRQHGYTCLVVDHLHSLSLDDAKQIITKYLSPESLFVGFSSTFASDKIESDLITHIKSINNNCKIVLGGTKATASISNKNIDYSIISYGEQSIINLANHLRTGSYLETYKNIFGVNIIDGRKDTGYDFVNSKFHWTDLDVGGAKVLPIEISRGCIFKCKFCSYPLNGKQNLDFIRHSDNLYEELQSSYDRFGIEDFYILDDTFNDNEYKLDVLYNTIKRLTFKPKFWAYTRLDLIAQNNSLIDKLYDIGLRGIYFGIETLNKRTGLIIGKGFDREKQIKTIEKIRNRFGNEIMLHGSFILGLPEEPVESMEQTFNQLMDNSIPLHSFVFHGLKLYKNEAVAFNSELGKNYTEYGYQDIGTDINSDKINWENKYCNYKLVEDLATNFNSIAQNDRIYLSKQIGLSLKNLGYSEEYISNTKFKDINWNDIQKRKIEYIDNYKKMILND